MVGARVDSRVGLVTGQYHVEVRQIVLTVFHFLGNTEIGNLDRALVVDWQDMIQTAIR